ncbi:diaminobutyrate acetyltransferase [Mangrovactinospora gilvigrisea]|uniref:L-2,4-diaminobutyric acid acetyltransferase n=1 Tax=Mangrovactinospora gilvigrisea TaxID=1428644 RepID=A0A1J7BZN9_9ACTN|nr:diaminobutyrate acetyltransferase [Mangrovactinospora gilvigrisea]OIV38953.1 diaminobutyrate acetyltransferase [Mangrovactinospora gilvigrisea]
MTSARPEITSPEAASDADSFDVPGVEDGAAIWRLARDSKTLDLNSSYSYLLWCRDFARTSVIARSADGEPAGFITGYVRPDEPRALVVWQVAVDAAQRGRGLAGRMLDHLADRVAGDAEPGSPVREIETTITADNAASIALFSAFARRRGTSVERRVLFDDALFPDGHPAEELHRIPLH